MKTDKLPLMKNAAAAPFIYFDGAPSMGTQGGLIEIELAARTVMPKPDGEAYVDMVCVAHLRCSAGAAANLRDALTRSLEMVMIEQAKANGVPFQQAPAALKQ